MPDIDDQLFEAYKTHGIGVGDIFEDCAFHPVLCLGADYQKDELWGISLIDGSYPRTCSFLHCGVRKLGLEEAWSLKLKGPPEAGDAERIAPERQWWGGVSPADVGLGAAKTILPLRMILETAPVAEQAG